MWHVFSIRPSRLEPLHQKVLVPQEHSRLSVVMSSLWIRRHKVFEENVEGTFFDLLSVPRFILRITQGKRQVAARLVAGVR